MDDRRSTSLTHFETFCWTYFSMNVCVPIAAPRCLFPSVVIETHVPSNSVAASDSFPSLTTSHVFKAFG